MESDGASQLCWARARPGVVGQGSDGAVAQPRCQGPGLGPGLARARPGQGQARARARSGQAQIDGHRATRRRRAVLCVVGGSAFVSSVGIF
jgi:hypothetical protein